MSMDVAPPPVVRGPGAGTVVLTINGQVRELRAEPRVSLLDALREHLGLTGSKKGCDQGTCGACTVWVDGRRVLACLTLAVTCEGREVTTIEGLSAGGGLHPMQAAFIDRDAFQCGYCTPGKLGIDPVELRLRNIADADPKTGNPWSSSGLRECLERGAARFGWAGRSPQPRSQREGNWLIGTGMATAGYPVAFFMRTQRARAHLYADGTAVVATAAQEFGTGMVTVLTQVAADGLGIDMRDVRLEFGDTDLPAAGSPVGSNGAMMVSAAVYNAGTAVRDQLIALAVSDTRSPLHGADPARIVVAGGRMTLAGDGKDANSGETYASLMQRHLMNDAEAIGNWDPPPLDTPYGLLTFGAQFARVAVDADLGIIRVRRMTGVFAPGRVLNPKTARSQLMGGMLWGMSQALLEGNHMDTKRGRWASTSLGDYLVPVNADAPDVDIELIEVEDHVTGPLGVKGVGEIGQVGSAAAIANAVYHATGYRPRDLLIAAEHLLPYLA